MSFRTLLAQASLLLSGLLLATKVDAAEFNGLDPTRYIVEFSDAGSAKFRKRDGSRDTEEFIDILRNTGAEVQPGFSFTSKLFHGASFELGNATDESIASIQRLPEVARVWPAAYFTLDFQPHARVEDSRQLAAWNPHKETNVSVVHEAGGLGEGIVVAIVDSGVDYNHPALGGGFGPGFKVEGGWDLLHDSPDPMDCAGHGTHVAGIIAADDEHVKGVAPKARLRMYKVFDCDGGTPEDMVIAAFLRAFEEGADVINASLGSDVGFPGTAITLVLSRIQAEGTMVVVAGGNAGLEGPLLSSSLAHTPDALAIGSIEQGDLLAFEVTARSSSGASRTFRYISGESRPFNLSANTQVSWIRGNTREHNACFFPDNPPAIPNNNIYILPRNSGCGWQSHDNSLNSRADWVFWYNFEGSEYEVPSRFIYDPSVQPVGAALISYQDGDWLVSQHEDGHQITLDFSSTAYLAAERPSFAGRRMNSFSSWGPTIDARMKPDVVAPGGSVFSTYLDGGWMTLSGTSMASPYVAGLAALVLQAHGTKGVREDAAAYARRRIVSSASPIRHASGIDADASIAHQGAGLVDAAKAVLQTTTISPPSISLNDTVHFQSTHEMKITNEGDEEVSYRITYQNEPTYFLSEPDGRINPSPSHSTNASNLARVELSMTEVVLGPGESASVELVFQEPRGVDPQMLPTYGGSIIVSGNNGDSVRLAYMGIKSSFKDRPHWGDDSPAFIDDDGSAMTEGKTYSFSPNTPVPYAPFVIRWSTEEFSYDFVGRDWTPEDWTWPLVPGEKNFYGHFRTEGNGNPFVVFDFPVRYFTRLALNLFARPTGTFSNGEQLVDGEYRYLRRSLKTFGDPTKLDDWDWDLSPWFRVQRD
ncbi:peptidase S8/S53 domain-containing protein [Stachybotrys elegans]|uniref:Peptidase S8/S53 domain-containing protein n=1 Tax=Stachybotrys elegans TaxID=80388 RepID=A0A8K0T4R1_9HYPO|nr:peptidase S8/S53 domain-containing protein [Stachybotrys elegans]